VDILAGLKEFSEVMADDTKRWQKVAQNRLISVHKVVSSDSKSSPKLEIKVPNSSQAKF